MLDRALTAPDLDQRKVTAHETKRAPDTQQRQGRRPARRTSMFRTPIKQVATQPRTGNPMRPCLVSRSASNPHKRVRTGKRLACRAMSTAPHALNAVLVLPPSPTPLAGGFPAPPTRCVPPDAQLRPRAALGHVGRGVHPLVEVKGDLACAHADRIVLSSISPLTAPPVPQHGVRWKARSPARVQWSIPQLLAFIAITCASPLRRSYQSRLPRPYARPASFCQPAPCPRPAPAPPRLPSAHLSAAGRRP